MHFTSLHQTIVSVSLANVKQISVCLTKYKLEKGISNNMISRRVYSDSAYNETWDS